MYFSAKNLQQHESQCWSTYLESTNRCVIKFRTLSKARVSWQSALLPNDTRNGSRVSIYLRYMYLYQWCKDYNSGCQWYENKKKFSNKMTPPVMDLQRQIYVYFDGVGGNFGTPLKTVNATFYGKSWIRRCLRMLQSLFNLDQSNCLFLLTHVSIFCLLFLLAILTQIDVVRIDKRFLIW